ncbi:hypothetical protein ES319_A01G202300v1 [Gossypium barbadense]|uniref:Uncharacterized protein n=1 Tax=Gossypium barbadense TaxID=3634 RepID=A0A5J5X0W8_GOSBA|nr:hypothetical protein ES319_A01G202300v1 [Gossypium barbadense]
MTHEQHPDLTIEGSTRGKSASDPRPYFRDIRDLTGAILRLDE